MAAQVWREAVIVIYKYPTKTYNKTKVLHPVQESVFIIPRPGLCYHYINLMVVIPL